jgi:hypothetical protein
LLAGLCIWLVLAATLVGQHEELCDLVGVLARRRDLDRASPVEVEVAKRERKRLDFQLRQIGVVLGNVEVRGKHTALGRVGWGQEEVEDSFGANSFILNQSLVDDAPRRWVSELTSFVLHEESLSDPLIDDNNSDMRFAGCLVVQLVDCTFELRDFSGQNLVAHGISNTVAEDHEVGWELLLVEVGEHVDRIFQCLLHAFLHDFLPLLLNDVLRIVLAHLLVC